MSNENEKLFVESILNFEHNLANVQTYIKENFETESSFDPETGVLNIWNDNINESVQIIAAKEYIEENLGLDKVQIAFGKI